VRQYNISIYDPPGEIRSGAALSEENMRHSLPFAAIFKQDSLKDICRLYGYLMLLGQNLEVELRVCLEYLQLALLLKGKPPRFAGNSEKATFDKLIEMFASQLDISDPNTEQLVKDLHQARLFRNRLAHGFLDVADSQYYLTPGGRASVLRRLKLAERVFFPLVMLVNMVGRAYYYSVK
jgi:hypothetical protein